MHREGKKEKEKETGGVKKGIAAAGIITFVSAILAGYLLYLVGKDKAAMSRCGCGKKD